MFAQYVSPWVTMADDAKFQATVDRIAALGHDHRRLPHAGRSAAPAWRQALAATRHHADRRSSRPSPIRRCSSRSSRRSPSLPDPTSSHLPPSPSLGARTSAADAAKLHPCRATRNRWRARWREGSTSGRGSSAPPARARGPARAGVRDRLPGGPALHVHRVRHERVRALALVRHLRARLRAPGTGRRGVAHDHRGTAHDRHRRPRAERRRGGDARRDGRAGRRAGAAADRRSRTPSPPRWSSRRSRSTRWAGSGAPICSPSCCSRSWGSGPRPVPWSRPRLALVAGALLAVCTLASEAAPLIVAPWLVLVVIAATRARAGPRARTGLLSLLCVGPDARWCCWSSPRTARRRTSRCERSSSTPPTSSRGTVRCSSSSATRSPRASSG